MAAKLRVIFVLFAVVVTTVAITPLQLMLLATRSRYRGKIPVLWHRIVLRLIGVRVFQHGDFARERPLMLAANHVSWADILVLGSLGELCFVAKKEVATWPGINWLSRMQRTVFVDRQQRRTAAVQADGIAARLAQGDVMVLFAEGTTGDGNQLLDFKSSLFAAPQFALRDTELESIAIQPVAIAYNTLHGMPLGRYHQALAAWPGDVGLLPHLARFVREGGFDVDVGFAESFLIEADSNRKQISRRCRDTVRSRFTHLRRLYHRDGQPI